MFDFKFSRCFKGKQMLDHNLFGSDTGNTLKLKDCTLQLKQIYIIYLKTALQYVLSKILQV